MNARRPESRRVQYADPHAGALPIVAIVGRPNVGKSTLFNRWVGASISIVEDEPGVTRDRLYAPARIAGREVILVDTGGLDPTSPDSRTRRVAKQVEVALRECDCVVLVVDASVPPNDDDRYAVSLLRRAERPVIVVANKAESAAARLSASEYFKLGVDEVHPLSALHGRGIAEAETAIGNALPEQTEATNTDTSGTTRVAIVGRPNAGKSSLVNRLLGDERQLVDERPGTTVDAVDALYVRGDARFILVDTAGIRRRRSVDEGVESLAVTQAIRALERSDVAVIVIDGEAGATEQDTKIAGLAAERGRAIVIAMNKIDLLDLDGRKRALAKVRDTLHFIPWAPIVEVSAKMGKGLPKIVAAVKKAAIEHGKRVTTSEINKLFEEVLVRHPPPIAKGRAVRLYYVSQVGTAPPTFAGICNYPDAMHFSYERYLINQIRERFGFAATPVRVVFRERRRNK